MIMIEIKRMKLVLLSLYLVKMLISYLNFIRSTQNSKISTKDYLLDNGKNCVLTTEQNTFRTKCVKLRTSKVSQINMIAFI